MKHSVMLTIASLLSILFFTFHLSRTVRRGGQQHQPINLARFGLDRRAAGDASSKVDNRLY